MDQEIHQDYCQGEQPSAIHPGYDHFLICSRWESLVLIVRSMNTPRVIGAFNLAQSRVQLDLL